MKFVRCGLLLLVSQFGLLHAQTIQIPYSGGKLADSVQIQTISYDHDFGTLPRLGSVFVEFGNLFSLYVRMTPPEEPLAGLCSWADSEKSKFFLGISTSGEAHQLADTASDWSQEASRPSEEALVPLSPLPAVASSDSVGFRFASEEICEGSIQLMFGKWNRVIFVRDGSRYAKFAITGWQDTAWGGLPSYQYLKSLTIRYVINDTNELSDLVSIRAPGVDRTASRGLGVSGAGRIEDLYNPLGVRLNRAPGRFEAAVPLRR